MHALKHFRRPPCHSARTHKKLDDHRTIKHRVSKANAKSAIVNSANTGSAPRKASGALFYTLKVHDVPIPQSLNLPFSHPELSEAGSRERERSLRVSKDMTMSDSEERPTKLRKLNGHSQGGVRSDVELQASAIAESSIVSAPQDQPREEILKTADEDNEGNDSETKDSTPVPGQALSKNQLKKIRKKEAWEAGREYRKLKRKEKQHDKKIRKQEERAANPKVEISDAPKAVEGRKRAVQVPMTLLLDCDFDELMTDKEIMSLASQLTRAYSDNRKAQFRSHLVVSSFGGQLKARFEGVLANAHKGWKAIKFTEKDFVAAAEEMDTVMRGEDGGVIAGALVQGAMAPASGSHGAQEAEQCSVAPVESSAATEKQSSVSQTKLDGNTIMAPEIVTAPTSTKPNVVYLSSDSPHTLTHLSPNTTYIIGGIVDKNRHKGLCYKRALDRNIPTAKLPIGEYMTMQSRTVLATNHVVEIMVRWLEEGDWGKAFLKVIPKRKEAKLRGAKGKEDEGQEEVQHEDEEDQANDDMGYEDEEKERENYAEEKKDDAQDVQ